MKKQKAKHTYVYQSNLDVYTQVCFVYSGNKRNSCVYMDVVRHFRATRDEYISEIIMEIEKEQIIKLKKIDGNRFFRKNPFKLFGSNNHKYELNNCLSEVEILDFEKYNQIELPLEYRNFIKNIGNGGAGPGYGIFKLEDWNFELDIENRNFLKENFPYTEKWNLPYNENIDDEDYTESEEFKNRELEYFNEKHIYGSIRICHYGCAIYCFLVVSGIEKGNIWIDSTANDDGIYPFTTELKSRYNFAEWYNEWIIESLKKLTK